MSKDHPDAHDEGTGYKRRKLANEHSDRRHRKRGARIFAPFRARLSILPASIRLLANMNMNFPPDPRLSILHRDPFHIHSAGKDYLSSYDFCGKMSAHLRSSKRSQSSVSDTSSNTHQHYGYVCMERSSVCRMGRRVRSQQGGCVAVQEREKG